MADKQSYQLAINIRDIDTNALPSDSRDITTDAFRTAARDFARRAVKQLGGDVQIKFDADDLVVTWLPARRKIDPGDRVIQMLNSGNLTEGVILLQLLLSGRPDDVTLLLNLGMALSDQGKLDQAEKHLRHLLEIMPGNANASVALGVALTRMNRNEEAEVELNRAVHLDTDNPYAHRNLGAVLLKLGKSEEALSHLRLAAELNPEDQRAWVGLAQALESAGDKGEADKAYRRTIQEGEHTPIAEMARTALSRIAQESFKSATPGTLRMDAVMYCLGAMERFDSMSRDEVQDITFEIAMLGTRGLDVNDSTQKYQFRGLSGDFSGLHLVCIEYVGFKIIDPSLDIGFDLSKEYAAAESLHRNRS